MPSQSSLSSNVNDVKMTLTEDFHIQMKSGTIDVFMLKEMNIPLKEFSLKDMKVIGHRGCGSDESRGTNDSDGSDGSDDGKGVRNKIRSIFGSKKVQSPSSKEFIPENTIHSFLEAHRKGADMVELDVHLTVDQTLVVYHDEILNNHFIPELTLSQFLKEGHKLYKDEEGGDEGYESDNDSPSQGRTLDGRNPSPPNKISFNHPPTFKAVLENLPVSLGINIEIKCPMHMMGSAYLSNLCSKTLKILETQPDRNFFFSSFSLHACLILKALSPKTKVCWLLCQEIYRFFPKETNLKEVLKIVKTFKFDGVVLSSELYYDCPAFVQDLLKNEILIFCYGSITNDREVAKKEERNGVSGLITDDIDLLVGRM